MDLKHQHHQWRRIWILIRATSVLSHVLACQLRALPCQEIDFARTFKRWYRQFFRITGFQRASPLYSGKYPPPERTNFQAQIQHEVSPTHNRSHKSAAPVSPGLRAELRLSVRFQARLQVGDCPSDSCPFRNGKIPLKIYIVHNRRYGPVLSVVFRVHVRRKPISLPSR